MSMLIPISYSCRNFYLAMMRYFSLWLAQVKQSQTNAPLVQPDYDRRSFQMAPARAASTMDSGGDRRMNRAFLMRFAAAIDSKNLNNQKHLNYENRQSTAPPFAWRLPAPQQQPPQRLRPGSEDSYSQKTELLPENRGFLHRLRRPGQTRQRLRAAGIP